MKKRNKKAYYKSLTTYKESATERFNLSARKRKFLKNLRKNQILSRILQLGIKANYQMTF
jgi:hypothetical protein